MRYPAPCPAPPTPSQAFDVRVLFLLGIVQKICLTIALLLAGFTFINWIIPPLGDMMPQFFRLMRANNAFLGVLCTLSLILLQPRRSAQAIRAGQALAALAILFAGLILASDFGWIGLGINTLFSPDSTHPFPGRVHPQAAFTYLLLALALLTLRARTRPLSVCADLLSSALGLTMANFLASYILGFSQLFTINVKNPFALQTYILLTVLTLVTCTRRAEFGIFAVLLSRGFGGQFARVAAPLALLLPFAFALTTASLSEPNVLNNPVVTARSIGMAAMFGLCTVLLVALRTDRLEQCLEAPILRDDLTRLYNHRGFQRLADTALHMARREGTPFFVLSLDLDGLRQINQTYGHRIGSDYLLTMACLLQENFGPAAVVGRIGGDEFMVASPGDAALRLELLHQLELKASQAHTVTGHPFDIGYTTGLAVEAANGAKAIQQMMSEAARDMNHTTRTTTSPLSRYPPLRFSRSDC